MNTQTHSLLTESGDFVCFCETNLDMSAIIVRSEHASGILTHHPYRLVEKKSANEWIIHVTNAVTEIPTGLISEFEIEVLSQTVTEPS